MKRIGFPALVSPLLIGLLLFTGSCSLLTNPGNRTTRKQGGVEYSIETDRRDYQLSNTVIILYRVTNQSGKIISLGSVPNCDYCKHQLTITQADQEIWKSCRVIPPCGWTEFSLQPGETWEYSENWGMTDDHGTLEPGDDFPVGSGHYQVSGQLYPGDGPRVPISVSINIK